MRALNRWARLRAGVLLTVCLIGVLTTALADVFVADYGRSSRQRDGGSEIFDDRIVNVAQIAASPGDVIRVFPDNLHGSAAFQSYEFFAVENGDGSQYLDGGAADRVYAARSGSVPDRWTDCCPMHITRPEAPEGVDSDWLDLVWILYYPEGVVRPAPGPERNEFDARVLAHPTSSTPEVIEASSVAFHRWIGVPLVSVFAVGAVGLGVLWVRRFLRGGRDFEPGEEAAGGVALVELGGRYLAYLQALLIGQALPLIAVVWFGLYFYELRFAEAVGPSAAWAVPLRLAVYVALAGIVLAWAVLTYRAFLARRRWLSIAHRPPDIL